LKGEKEKMRLPLSKAEYAALEKLAKEHGLTVDQEAQVALLYFFKKYDLTLFDMAKKHVDPETLQVLERSVRT